MIRFISAEFLKLRKRPMTKVLLFVLLGMMVAVYMFVFFATTAPPGEEFTILPLLQDLRFSIPFAMLILFQIGTILAIVLSAGSIGGEYGWGTIRTTLICSESRAKFLAAKLITVLLMVLVGMIIGLVVGFVTCLITTAIGGLPFDLGFITAGYLWDQFLQFWRTFFIIMPYVLLAFLLSILGRSAMPGIAISVGVFFMESLFATLFKAAGGWIAHIPDYLPAANTAPIMALIQPLPEGLKEEMGLVASGVWQAAAVLAGYCILFLVLSFYLFRRRDVTV